MHRLAERYPQENAERSGALLPIYDVFVGNARERLLVLLGAVGLVLLIACVNVANLLVGPGGQPGAGAGGPGVARSGALAAGPAAGDRDRGAGGRGGGAGHGDRGPGPSRAPGDRAGRRAEARRGRDQPADPALHGRSRDRQHVARRPAPGLARGGGRSRGRAPRRGAGRIVARRRAAQARPGVDRGGAGAGAAGGRRAPGADGAVPGAARSGLRSESGAVRPSHARQGQLSRVGRGDGRVRTPRRRAPRGAGRPRRPPSPRRCRSGRAGAPTGSFRKAARSKPPAGSIPGCAW